MLTKKKKKWKIKVSIILYKNKWKWIIFDYEKIKLKKIFSYKKKKDSIRNLEILLVKIEYLLKIMKFFFF